MGAKEIFHIYFQWIYNPPAASAPVADDSSDSCVPVNDDVSNTGVSDLLALFLQWQSR